MNTPFRDQLDLPNFDAAAKDFNFVSLFGENAFSGVDRVSDAHQLTLASPPRLVDGASGAERCAWAMVQRTCCATSGSRRTDGSPVGL